MEAEILNYKEQVAALDSALQADPANEELLTIKTELLELITLTETLLQQEQQAAAASTAAAAPSTSTTSSSVVPPTSSTSTSQPPSPPASSQIRDPSTQRTQKPGGASAADLSNQPIYQPPAPTKHWVVGDRCRALYAADGKFYEATILGVATGAEGPIYSVQYKGYETTAPSTLTAQDLKVIPDTKKYQKGHHASATAATEAGTVAGGATVEGDKRKRGAEGGAGGGAGGEGAKKKKSTPSEQVQKQMAWQSFAKGGAKKAKGSGGILKKSIFATPDNPEGKVGVVGSGKGMTQFQQRGKHVYGSAPSSH
ncbi:hypothetical protein BGZ82_007341 [Podila clonocystis]|nr:hypothetical protein BGZ82_007341 [Podila clonocystis]